MRDFYVGIVTPEPDSVVVQAENFDEAFWEAVMNQNKQFAIPPITIIERCSGKTKTVISFCPECAVHVWMLTDAVGVYQHVDCYNTDRFCSGK